MNNTITEKFHGQALKECPAEAFELRSGPVCFADDDGKVGNRIQLQLCDGSVSLHWFWGNMAFNLAGITLAKERIPILFAHDTDQRLGMSTGHSTEPAFVLDGEFLSNPKAAEIKQDVTDGFEFESSLRFDMDKGVITHVKDGESVVVNGNRLEGPGTVFEKSTIMEGSICVFGAQDNCSTKVFYEINNRKDVKMAKLKLEQFKADNPDLFEEIRKAAHDEGKAEGVQGQIVLFKAIQDVCPDPAVAAKCFNDGLDADAAKTAYLESENASLKAKLAAKDDGETELSEAERKAQVVLDGKASAAQMEFADDATKVKKKKGVSEDEAKMTDKQLQERFDNSDELKEEFGLDGFGSYKAFVRHNAKGAVKILDRKS